MSATSPHTYRNDKYYLLGGDLHFLVGGREFFRVHRYFFDRESEHFRNWFERNPAGGIDDSSAIVLEDLEPRDFETFLWVFYNPIYWHHDASQEEWAIILGLSQQWGFLVVKKFARMQLDKIEMNLIDRIELYQRWEVDEDVILPYYVQLCERPEQPTYPEMMRLGQRTAYVIYAARERLRAATINEDGTSPIVKGRDVRATLEELLRGVPQIQVDFMKETGSTPTSPSSWSRFHPYEPANGHNKGTFVNSNAGIDRRGGVSTAKRGNRSPTSKSKVDRDSPI